MKGLLPILLVLPLWLSAQSPVLHTVDRLPEGGELVPRKAYPSYPLYERSLYAMARRYPDRCRVENWGRLPSGRRILALRLTADVATDPARPRVLATAAMHGDEPAGYWLLLRLAEDLLENNPGGLLDAVDIYLNPLANPDGAFAAGNQTLSGARRGNGHGVDLNRNYPDPDDGRYPDGNDHQPETRIFMEVATTHGFDLAINFHGGAELFNYPWDTFRSRHPDTDWWRTISREFAALAQRDSPDPTYFRDRYNGITNGHDWYPISGSRQDYMNYYHRAREATVEITDVKRYPAHRLPELWLSTRAALINFINTARYGIHGIVTDSQTGRPLYAHITIPGHDNTRSSVFTEADTGDFYRFLAPGTYRLLVSAPGYRTRSLIVDLVEKERQYLRVALEREANARK